jgi:hypothetical protein
MSLVVTGSLLLAGCSGGAPADPGTASPTVADSASPSATSTPTPTPSAVYKPADASGPAQNVPVPVLPEVAKTETKEGLEAFVRYWYATLSYAYETGDLSSLVAVTAPGCANCEAAEKVVSNWYSDGRWLEGGTIQTPAIETSFKMAPDGNYQVVVQVRQSELRAYKADRTASNTVIPATDVAQIFLAKHSSEGWKLTDAQRLNG